MELNLKDAEGASGVINSAERRPRVLVADDEQHITRMLDRILTRQGYDVTAVNDGRAALTALESEDFDRVVLDLMMPYFDGYEILSWIRQHPTKSQTWVALMVERAKELEKIDTPYRFDLYVDTDGDNLLPWL